MRLTLKNTVGSPFDIQTLNGPAILPAFGEFTGDFSDQDAEMHRASGAVVVTDAPSVSANPKKSRVTGEDEGDEFPALKFEPTEGDGEASYTGEPDPNEIGQRGDRWETPKKKRKDR